MIRSPIAFAFVVVIVSLASVAAAQDVDPGAEARRQYNLGTQAYAAHRFVEAALAFEAAAAYKANAVTLYTAALAWEQANQPERAADAFGRAIEQPGLLPQQQTNAHEKIAALEKSLGTLVLSGPEKTKVQLDSLTEVVVSPPGGVPARLHAPAGSHVLAIRFADGATEKRDVVLETGKAMTMEIAKAAVVVPPTPKDTNPTPLPVVVQKPPEEKPVPITRFIGFGLIGAGVVAGVSTIVLGLSANDARDAYNAAPSQNGFDHGNALATWTNVAWVTGAVLVAGGVALVLIPGPKAAKASVAPTANGFVLGGSF